MFLSTKKCLGGLRLSHMSVQMLLREKGTLSLVIILHLVQAGKTV